MKQINEVLLSVVIAALVLGCGGSTRITKENFEKLKTQMSKPEVVAILGDPTGQEIVAEANGKKKIGLVWQERRTKIVLAFSADEKLIFSSIEVE